MMNHPFLGALCTVACKQELLLDLIASDELATLGAYTFQVWLVRLVRLVRLCKEGRARIASAMLLDDGALYML